MDTALLTRIALIGIPVIVAITFHEAAHGYVAHHFGDDTAKNAGRLTLNPLKHVDFFGTILLPLVLLFSTGFIFGYAKPVPVNFGALKNPRRDTILVAFAGPAMNILLAIASAILLRVVLSAGGANARLLTNLLNRSLELNVVLAIFNLLPIPPLDGSKVLAPLLPWSIARPYLSLERFGMTILILLLVVVPILTQRSGTNFDIFEWLVQRPAEYLIRGILTLTGGV